MSTLAEIEAAVDGLRAPEQERLFTLLAAKLGRRAGIAPSVVPPAGHGVLDIPPAHVGRILRPLTADDDLLGEMLEGRS